MLHSFSLIFGIVVLLSIINYKWLKLPTTIGLMILSLITVGVLHLIRPLSEELFNTFCDIVLATNFEELLFDGLLGFLLFAGAININLKELAQEKRAVFIFATFGTILSTFIVGSVTFLVAPLVGVEMPFVYCLLFGSLISPTDPIAVLAILKEAGIKKSLQLKIEGESLFNDGIGVVVFSAILLLLPVMKTESSITAEITLLFLEEAVGGLVFGFVLGVIGYILIKSIFDNPPLAVLTAIGVVITGTTLAQSIHVSAPLAMVVCGLYIGNKLSTNHEMGNRTSTYMIEFWELIDQAFNGVLFVLIGLSIHLLSFNFKYLVLGLISIFVVLGARYIAVYLGYSLLKHTEEDKNATVKVLTWGGLRGGISIALALSLGEYEYSDPIIFITYIVVLFSILVQGLTLKALVKKLMV